MLWDTYSCLCSFWPRWRRSGVKMSPLLKAVNQCSPVWLISDKAAWRDATMQTFPRLFWPKKPIWSCDLSHVYKSLMLPVFHSVPFLSLLPSFYFSSHLLSVCNADYPCEGMSRHATFENFGMAFLTLFQVSTGDNWNGIMKVIQFTASSYYTYHLTFATWPGRSNWQHWSILTFLHCHLISDFTGGTNFLKWSSVRKGTVLMCLDICTGIHFLCCPYLF